MMPQQQAVVVAQPIQQQQQRPPMMNDVFLANGFHMWNVGVCESWYKEPGLFCQNLFCLCCNAHKQREETSDPGTHFRCLDQGGPGTLVPCDSCADCLVCPKSPCMCCESFCCPILSIHRSRRRIMQRLKLRNSDCDDIVLQGVTSGSSSHGGGGWCAWCCCACILTQQQAELRQFGFGAGFPFFPPPPPQQQMPPLGGFPGVSPNSISSRMNDVQQQQPQPQQVVMVPVVTPAPGASIMQAPPQLHQLPPVYAASSSSMSVSSSSSPRSSSPGAAAAAPGGYVGFVSSQQQQQHSQYVPLQQPQQQQSHYSQYVPLQQTPQQQPHYEMHQVHSQVPQQQQAAAPAPIPSVYPSFGLLNRSAQQQGYAPLPQ